VPNVEIKRKVRLTRQEAAERLIALGNALAGGSEVDRRSDGASIKLGVAGHVDWELEIEVDGDGDRTRDRDQVEGRPGH
jgi:amphi-Trp domain-containing protein